MGAINDPAAVYHAAVSGVGGHPLGVAEQVYLDSDTGTPTWALVAGPALPGQRLVPLDDATLTGTGVSVPYDAADLAGAPVRDPSTQLTPADELALPSYYNRLPRVGDPSEYSRQTIEGTYPMSSSFSEQTRDAAAQTSGTAKDEAAVTAQTAKDEAGATAQTAQAEAAATAQTAKDEAAVTAQTAQAEAKHVAATASSAASDVVGTTKEQAGNVASEALDQVRDLTDQLRVQLSEQAGTAASKLGQAVRSLAEELHDMGSNTGARSGAASQAAHQLSERGHRIADYLDGTDPDSMLADARTSAARRPGRFLLGAVVAGVLAGRLARGAKAAKDSPDTAATPVAAATPVPAVPATTTTTAAYPTYDASVQPAGYGTVPGAHLGSDLDYAPITSSADSALR